ncbi:alternative ribosome rescue aminoacyl-tRNA hydrolase ArfB [Bizionia sediminis]|uniref:Alternative ribosome rescue aminoacyl-tRNA hydrolase ArfB n=1 Tax=Bizionia sediminis TaxID=1737064 RepID=A0ABW5KUF8_9FLAO
MFNESLLISELSFKASRSSGAGGQHVNKTASKVQLIWDLNNSAVFSDMQKKRLAVKLKDKLTANGMVLLSSETSRSQHQNKAQVIKRFLKLVAQGLVVSKKRKPTKIPKSVKLKRLSNKKKHAEKKSQSETSQ